MVGPVTPSPYRASNCLRAADPLRRQVKRSLAGRGANFRFRDNLNKLLMGLLGSGTAVHAAPCIPPVGVGILRGWYLEGMLKEPVSAEARWYDGLFGNSRRTRASMQRISATRCV